MTIRRFLMLGGASAMLGACAPSPVGTWAGTMDFLTDDGNTYTNEMVVSNDGTADITLYVIFEQNQELMLGVSWFLADWEQDKEEVVFDLVCDWEGCAYEFTMDCAFDEDMLFCDMVPDFYADDEAVLEWERADE